MSNGLFIIQISGIAVAELEFHHPNDTSKAEKSWKEIASLLQFILGCNVEIRINLASYDSDPKYAKVRKPSFSLFSCSRRTQRKCQTSTEHGSDSDQFDYTSEKAMIRDRAILISSSDGGSHMPHNFCHKTEVVRTLRNSEGNALSTGTAPTCRSLQNDLPKIPMLGVDSSTEEGSNRGSQVLFVQEPEDQPNCFLRTLRLQKKLRSSDSTQIVCSGIEKENTFALPIPRKSSVEICTASDDNV